MIDLHSVGLWHLGHFLRLDVQHHYPFVQDLVVFEIVQQGTWNCVGIARQEHRGAKIRRRGRRARLARKERSEGAPRCSRWNNAARPVRHVDIKA